MQCMYVWVLLWDLNNMIDFFCLNAGDEFCMADILLSRMPVGMLQSPWLPRVLTVLTQMQSTPLQPRVHGYTSSLSKRLWQRCWMTLIRQIRSVLQCLILNFCSEEFAFVATVDASLFSYIDLIVICVNQKLGFLNVMEIILSQQGNT